jgi:polyisoprenyl-phosphate glycosyltransferase
MNLSIVIPVFNSSDILEKLIERINLSLNQNNLENKFEIILVNDSSLDNSWNKIKTLSNKFSNVKGLNLIKNYGQHNAIMAGLNECSGDKIITMDDDLQHPPESIKDIYDELEKGYDSCYTYYVNRQHHLIKRFISWINNLVSSYLLNKPFKIYLSSFRGFKRNILLEVIKYKKPSVYLDGLILATTRNISMITVPHQKRFQGDSNYSFTKLFSLWFDMAINFPVYPLRFATLFGLIIKYLILIYRKFFISREIKKSQYSIKEKTY